MTAIALPEPSGLSSGGLRRVVSNVWLSSGGKSLASALDQLLVTHFSLTDEVRAGAGRDSECRTRKLEPWHTQYSRSRTWKSEIGASASVLSWTSKACLDWMRWILQQCHPWVANYILRNVRACWIGPELRKTWVRNLRRCDGGSLVAQVLHHVCSESSNDAILWIKWKVIWDLTHGLHKVILWCLDPREFLSKERLLNSRLRYHTYHSPMLYPLSLCSIAIHASLPACRLTGMAVLYSQKNWSWRKSEGRAVFIPKLLGAWCRCRSGDPTCTWRLGWNTWSLRRCMWTRSLRANVRRCLSWHQCSHTICMCPLDPFLISWYCMPISWVTCLQQSGMIKSHSLEGCFNILAASIHSEQINICNRLGPINTGVPPMLAQG